MLAFAAFAVTSAYGHGVSAETRRTYRVEEQRAYEGGETVAVAAFTVRSEDQGDGITRHRYRLDGALTVDSAWGAIGAEARELPELTSTTTSDRRAIITGPFPRGSVNASAVLGAAARPGQDCATFTREEMLPMAAEAGLPAALLVRFNGERAESGFCILSWEAAETTASSASGRPLKFTMRGLIVANLDFSEMYLSVSATDGDVGGSRFSNRRAIALQLEPHKADLEKAWDALEAAGGSDLLIPSRAIGLDGTEPALKAANVADASVAAAASAFLEISVLGFAEQKVNPLPLATIGVFYLTDQAATRIVNGVGYALLGGGSLFGSQTASYIGGRFTKYDGVFGETLQLVAGRTGQAFGLDPKLTGERAVAIYNLASLGFGGLERAAQPRISQFLLTNPRFNNLVNQLFVARGSIGAAETATNVANSLVNLVGESNINAVMDWMSSDADSAVSVTPTAHPAMNDLVNRNQPDQASLDGSRNPFTTTTDGRVSDSTAGLADVVITGLLSFRIFDFALQDGDQVDLSVTPGGPFVSLNLTNAGASFTAPGAREGTLAVIRLTALNEGTASPNTGAIALQSLVVSGSPNQQYSLMTGQSGFMRVYVLGRRARSNP
ncbi:hypothetical protein BZG35_05050 [Brevundimonas sp. LM2]|nr:hypothetical protein BZG35_05050 [Brevundimonas sp. LM2]